VLAARARAGSQPGRRDDGFRVAPAVEGGGMRGTVSAGMALALDELGLVTAIDAVYGASAGAIMKRASPGQGAAGVGRGVGGPQVAPQDAGGAVGPRVARWMLASAPSATERKPVLRYTRPGITERLTRA
jgi:hypothetical protein